MTTVERDPRHYSKTNRSGPVIANDQPPILLRLPNVLNSDKSVETGGRSLRRDVASSVPPPFVDLGVESTRKSAKEANAVTEPPLSSSGREPSMYSESSASRTPSTPEATTGLQERSFAERFGSRVTLIILMLAFGLATLIALKGQKSGPVIPQDADELALELALGDSVVEEVKVGSLQESTSGPTSDVASKQPKEEQGDGIPDIDFSKPSMAEVASTDTVTSSAPADQIDLNSPAESNMNPAVEPIVTIKLPSGGSSDLPSPSVEKSDELPGTLNFDPPARQLASSPLPSGVGGPKTGDHGSRNDSQNYPRTTYPNRVRWLQFHPEVSAPEVRARVAEVPTQPAPGPSYSPGESNLRNGAGNIPSTPTREPPSSYQSTPYQGTGGNPWSNYLPPTATGTISR